MTRLHRSANRMTLPRLRGLAPMLALAFAVAAGLATAAGATSLKDLQVGIRGVEFLTEPPRGQVPVAIIQDSQNKASQQDAHAIIGWLAGMSRSAKVEFVPVVVDARDLDTAPQYRVAIVAGGVDAHFVKVLDYARRHGTLTITADISCVRSGNCVLGVATEPSVEVVVSRQASLACGVDFVRAFRMMVKEY